MKERMEEIHESFINGQNRQAFEQAKQYGFYDFFADYSEYLISVYPDNPREKYNYLENAILIYSRIKYR